MQEKKNIASCFLQKTESYRLLFFLRITGIVLDQVLARRIRLVNASPNASKAPSPYDFKATWGICRPEDAVTESEKARSHILRSDAIRMQFPPPLHLTILVFANMSFKVDSSI